MKGKVLVAKLNPPPLHCSQFKDRQAPEAFRPTTQKNKKKIPQASLPPLESYSWYFVIIF